MKPETLVVDTDLGARARKAIYRAVPRLEPGYVKLTDVAKLMSADLLAVRRCGPGTVDAIKAVLLKAGLYLADDTPELWGSDREHYTSRFARRAGADHTKVVRLLCDHMTTAQLAAAAAELPDGGDRDDVDESPEGRGQQG